MGLRAPALAGLLAATTVWPAEALAQAALILDVVGEVDPPLAPFDEAPAGTAFRLAEDAEIELLHYAACAELRARGGIVSVTDMALRASRMAEILHERAEVCPSVVSLAGETTTAGALILRGEGSDETAAPAPPRPTFLLAGASGVEAVALTREGAETVVLPVRNGAARYGADRPPLAPGARYAVRALAAPDADAETAAVVATVEIVESAGPVVLRP